MAAPPEDARPEDEPEAGAADAEAPAPGVELKPPGAASAPSSEDDAEAAAALEEFAAVAGEPSASEVTPQRHAPVDDAPAAASAAPSRPVVDDQPRSAEPPATPYGHLLRIRGDVDQTKAIGLFLAGLCAFGLLWLFLTAGSPDPREHNAAIGADGRVAVPDALDQDARVYVNGYAQVEDYTAEDAPSDREFFLEGGSETRLRFDPSLAGQEVTFGYDLGSQPIVSAFLLPKPSKVFSALIELFTGPAYMVSVSHPDWKQEQREVYLSASEGAALEAYRVGSMDDQSPVPPPQVVAPGTDFVLDGEIAIALPPQGFRAGLVSTVKRTLIGFLCATLICFPLGVLAGTFPPIKRLISPVEIAGGYTPPVVLVPLVVAVSSFLSNPDSLNWSPAWAADGARVGFFLVLVISFWLYPLVTKEIESVHEIYINTGYTLGANRWQVVRHVMIPISLANVWEHLRACYAIGWASIILAEGYGPGKVTGEFGIGFFMVEMQRRHKMENYFAALIAIVITGIVIDYGFKLLGRWLFPYREAA
ncbi:MAG: ABC transporter permease subunit [Planctomycetes bacterium]|nr:ABC transporter permease subunit [Planctomycetota bacterium]